jgi:geranylgeranyl pyrophosphate synthase
MLIHLLGVAGPQDRVWVVGYLSRAEDDRSPADQERLLALMIDAGSLAYAERFATVLATAAQQSLATAFADVPHSPAVDVLRELIDYLVSRTD